MTDLMRDLFNKAIRFYQDGTIFNIGDNQYMIITGMVIEDIDTGKQYFKGLDF